MKEVRKDVQQYYHGANTLIIDYQWVSLARQTFPICYDGSTWRLGLRISIHWQYLINSTHGETEEDYLNLQSTQDQLELTIVPDFNEDDWEGFVIGTEEYIGSVNRAGGVPLLYLIRDEPLKPAIIWHFSIAICAKKTYWIAKFSGIFFMSDQTCV